MGRFTVNFYRHVFLQHPASKMTDDVDGSPPVQRSFFGQCGDSMYADQDHAEHGIPQVPPVADVLAVEETGGKKTSADCINAKVFAGSKSTTMSADMNATD